MGSLVQEAEFGGTLAKATVAMAGNKITRPYAEYKLGFLIGHQRASGGTPATLGRGFQEADGRNIFPTVTRLRNLCPFSCWRLPLWWPERSLSLKAGKNHRQSPRINGNEIPGMALGIFVLVYAW
jgi:hypothetical protein